MEIFTQGYRLQYADLNYRFYSYSYINASPLDNIGTTLTYYPGAPLPYSPFWVAYGVGYIDGDGHYHEFGERYRIPTQLQTGLYQPNFIIGEDWATGIYEIRWKYRVSATDDILIQKVRFEVVTAGILDQPGNFADYVDVSGAMVVTV